MPATLVTWKTTKKKKLLRSQRYVEMLCVVWLKSIEMEKRRTQQKCVRANTFDDNDSVEN